MTFHPRGIRPGETQTRFASTKPSSLNLDARTVQCIMSAGSAVTRSFGIEKLEISKRAVILDRLNTVGIPILNSHRHDDITSSVGQLKRAWIKGGELLGEMQFNQTPEGDYALGMIERGELKGVSIGYQVREWTISDADGNVIDPETTRISFGDDLIFTASRFEVLELSLCSVAADPDARVRSLGGNAGSSISDVRARMRARQRMASAGNAFKPTPAERPNHLGQAQRENTKESTNMNYIETIRDEREGVADAMQIALTSRILASRGRSTTIAYQGVDQNEKDWISQHRSQAQQYMGMGLVEMAAACIGYRGRGNFLRAADAVEILHRAFNSTSDFPNIFQNALNKALLARYVLAAPTYREIAAERSFNDFRPHPQIRAGDFPQLKPVLETGELAYASSTDSGETISVSPYGIVFSISRQMLVNDDLGAIDQILGSAGDMVLVFENTTFFAMFNANPVLLQDSTAVFASGHNNLVASGSGAAPSVATIGAARQALRGMKSISGNFINVPPSIILTGPQQETAADQSVASITPTLTTSVNPFSGRLRSVSDANITDTSWYIATDPAKVPNFVYGFLAGSGGPRTRTYEPFGSQGVKVSLEHDFGCGAIDYRGMFKNAGS
jgi:Caudovirus prohead serine protease